MGSRVRASRSKDDRRALVVAAVRDYGEPITSAALLELTGLAGNTLSIELTAARKLGEIESRFFGKGDQRWSYVPEDQRRAAVRAADDVAGPAGRRIARALGAELTASADELALMVERMCQMHARARRRLEEIGVPAGNIVEMVEYAADALARRPEATRANDAETGMLVDFGHRLRALREEARGVAGVVHANPLWRVFGKGNDVDDVLRMGLRALEVLLADSGGGRAGG